MNQFSQLFDYASELFVCTDLFQALIVSNSAICLVYLGFTALAHTTNNATFKALAHTVRHVSLCCGGLVITFILIKHGVGSLKYCFDLLAIYGLYGALLVVVLNYYESSPFQSVRWVVTLNLMVLSSIVLIKAQSIATGRPWAPEEFHAAWFWYSVFYLVAVSTARSFNMRPFHSPRFLSAFDRFINIIEPRDGAIRSACSLCLTMIHFTGLMLTNESVSVFVMLIIFCQLGLSFILAFRFSAKCPDAKLTDPFVAHIYINLGESLAVARKQASEGVLPRYSPWLFFVVLFSSFNTLSPAYCSGLLNDDDAVASPVSEGAQASRGVSAAGEFASTLRSAASRPGGQEQFVGAIYNAIPTGVGAAAGYYYGQAQAEQVCDSVNIMGEKVDRLNTEVEKLSEQEAIQQETGCKMKTIV